MKTVNALEIRNHLGSVLDELRDKRQPILVSKGREIRAVLITPEDFKTRFVDKQAEEERAQLLQRIADLKQDREGETDSVDVLRGIRGYSD